MRVVFPAQWQAGLDRSVRPEALARLIADEPLSGRQQDDDVALLALQSATENVSVQG